MCFFEGHLCAGGEVDRTAEMTKTADPKGSAVYCSG